VAAEPVAPPAAEAADGDGQPGGHVVAPRPSPAHRAVPLIAGALPWAALVIALMLGLTALLVGTGGDRPEPGPSAAPAPAVAPAPTTVSGPTVSASTPTSVVAGEVALRPTEVNLPRIGARSALVDLDVGPDGALQAPADPDVAGWYVGGAVPGEPGPAVIAGHVDSQAGPAVFYRLDELVAGDRIEVTRSDGRVLAYRVVTVQSFPKTAFPTARVYGPTPGPELRLITCGGDFDRRSRHYADNVIVTAFPVT
jgi:hypothetical protein